MSKRSSRKVLGNFFVLFILAVIFWIYYSFVLVFWTSILAPFTDFFLGLQLFLFFLMLWSFFKAMITDPGSVPPLWGFYMGDSESKRRRYCLMCHVFKPERCHHCSACNKCVLNMDHHCRNI